MPSLKARAVAYLSRREHSRVELARKLAPHSQEDPDALRAVLDDLERGGWLSTVRFAQGLVHRRAAKLGTARVLDELRRHEVPAEELKVLQEQLRATEAQRAQEVWDKRFGGQPPADTADYARQARFLAARGFTHDTIRKLLG